MLARLIAEGKSTGRRPPAIPRRQESFSERNQMSIRTSLDFLLYDWLQVANLNERLRFSDHSREAFDAVLDTARIRARLCMGQHLSVQGGAPGSGHSGPRLCPPPPHGATSNSPSDCPPAP